MDEFVKKLIERLEENTIQHKEAINLFNKYGIKFVSASKVKEIVNQLAEEHKGGWIPCSERMPENSNPVLVHAVKKRSDTASLYSAYFENGKGWISVYDRKPMKEYYIEPLYWMPLPEPPVEKGGVE